MKFYPLCTPGRFISQNANISLYTGVKSQTTSYARWTAKFVSNLRLGHAFEAEVVFASKLHEIPILGAWKEPLLLFNWTLYAYTNLPFM